MSEHSWRRSLVHPSGTKLVEGAVQVIGVDGAGVLKGGRRQRVVGDAVDLARQPAGALEQRLCGRRLEQRQLAAGQTESMGQVGVEFAAVETADVMAHDQALVERFVNRHGQPAAQLGESDQQQTQAVL